MEVQVFNLRINNELYKRLKEAAEKEERSINNYLLRIIKSHLDK